MKKILATIIFVFVCLGFNNQAFAYSDFLDHYSFDIPSGWREIPKVELDKVSDAVAKQSNTKRIEYIAGFQSGSNEYFKYPYILVQKHTLDTPSFSQLEKTFNNSNLQKKADQKTPEYSELLKSATTSEPFIDKERKIIFINLKMDVTNVGKVNGLMAMFLGKNGITQLNFYSTENDYSKWLPVFNSIVDSFKYEDGFVYNSAEAVKNDSKANTDGVVDQGLTGAISGGFLMLFVVLIGMLFIKRKKSDGEVNVNMEAIKYCKECGNEISSSSASCNKCGKVIDIKN